MRKIFVMFLSILLIIISFVALNKTGDKKVKDKKKEVITTQPVITKPVVTEPITVPTTKPTTDIIDNNEKDNEENVNNEVIDDDYSTISTFIKENNERYKSFNKLNPTMSKEEVVKRVNVSIDYKFYEKKYDALNPYTPLILVNKYYYIDENYVPTDLEEVNIECASGRNILASKGAKDKFVEMCTDAKNLGYTVKAVSVYRSYNYQKVLYNQYLENDSQASVDTYSARAGHSEHQTGLAFDVYNGSVSYTNFGITNEFKWVRENAHKYGFIIRYTEQNEFITGYKNEPWHLRYVGIEPATYIYNNNITLEEYLLNRK